MEAVGYGKRKPLVANDSEANRAINRRVEIKVLDF
jgi:outer membrane protein OmpA-like peptidoglycan-associated protein